MNSVPILRVKRFNPAFEREHHLGPRTRRAARNRIELEASLARDKQIAASTRASVRDTGRVG